MVKKPTTRTSPKTAKSVATAKPASPAKPATPTAPRVVVTAPTPVVAAPMMKKKELIERVVELSGLKKKDVKPTVEAVLTILGRAIADGEDLNLQPLGKLMVKNRAEKPNGTVINFRLRQAKVTVGPAGAPKPATAFGTDSHDAISGGADTLAVPTK